MPPWTKIPAFKGMSQRACGPGSPKKPRGKALSAADQFINSIVSSVRVVVEHVIAGVKRCRIVKDVLRLTHEGVSDLVMEIACGLHNLRMSCRHPLPAVDLLGQFNQT